MKMDEIKMSQEEMISALDKAAGMLLVASMKDATVRQAMELITNVSLSLGEIKTIEWAEW